MEAYHIDRFGSVDDIILRSSEDPKEVLMRVRAGSLNYRGTPTLVVDYHRFVGAPSPKTA